MIVVDASALADWLLQSPAAGEAVADALRADGDPHTVDLADVEVLSTIRRKERSREIATDRAAQIVNGLAVVPLIRHATSAFRSRIWELRHTHTTYDAAYVALAEALDAPLLTTDQRMARSGGHTAQIVCPTA